MSPADLANLADLQLQQEEGNAQLLFENGCAELCETPDALATTIERLFAGDAAEWRAWERAIGSLSKPDAALQIAGAILKEIESEPGKKRPSP